jgi:hypothetical protein
LLHPDAIDNVAKALLRKKIQQDDQDQQQGQQKNDNSQCGVHGIPHQWALGSIGRTAMVLRFDQCSAVATGFF